MTLIIGIKCRDGVVLGADGAAMVVDEKLQPTIREPAPQKLTILRKRVVVGFSGHVGIGQRIVDGIDEAWKENKFSGKSPTETLNIFSDITRKMITPILLDAGERAKVFGEQCISDLMTTAAIAIIAKDAPCLLQFDLRGSSHGADENQPWFTLGSCSQIADPFLAFLRRIFWPKGFPTAAQAKLSVVWTLTHAIETNAGCVDHGIQLTELTRVGKDWEASQLTPEELDRVAQDIRDAERVTADFRSHLACSVAPSPGSKT